MNERGFTLVEIIITIAVIGILVAIATLDYSAWNRKYQSESQLKAMYADLAGAKLDALHKKTDRSVTLTSTGYTIRRADTGATLLQKTIKYPITWSHGNILTFNTRGLFANMTTPQTICLSSGAELGRDCLIVSTTKIDMGKRSSGAACAYSNCVIK